MTQLLYRPLGPWPRTPSPPKASQFTASWSDTLALLGAEVDQVRRRDQRDDPIILQIDVPESAIRLDGGVRANARAASHAIIVSFESKHGPLRYLCDTYSQVAWKVRSTQQPWQANVRAVALGLEALRSVDRYGIASDGEQYRGFTALPPAGGSAPDLDARLAAAFLAQWSGLDVAADSPPQLVDRAYRSAARVLHPDAPFGDAAKFRYLTAARDLLLAVHR